MDFATKSPGAGRVALVLGAPLLHRLKRGLVPLVGPDRDYGHIDIGLEPARILEQIQEWRPVGIITEFREGLTEVLLSLGVPVVVVMADMLIEGAGSVNVNDRAVGRMAAEYLWNKGFRRFAFCGLELPHAPERRTGFVEFIESKGRDPAVLEIAVERWEGWHKHQRDALLDKWLASLPHSVGVFAAHDPLGRALLESSSRLGLRVPDNMAVLSASNDQFTCELVYPAISSVEIPWERIGNEAGRMLEEMLQGHVDEEPVLVPPRGIRTRRSTDYYRVSDERIQHAVAMMRDWLSEEIDISEIVRRLGMHRRVLERLFRSQLEKSPKEVLTDMRTERAREMLEQSELPIGEISASCGFGSSEKMAAAFRKRYGQTPSDWRRQNAIRS